jgi:hypothetical protein
LTVSLAFATSQASAGIGDEIEILKRGDANNDNVVDLSDAVFIANYLEGGPRPPCKNQADADDNGSILSTDSTYLLNWLYSGGPAPPDPGPFNTACKLDKTLPNETCEASCD